MPTNPRSPLQELLQAKAWSDQRNYPAKHAILRSLIRQSPDDWAIDSEQDGIVGLTHVPLNFRIHIPRRQMPTEVPVSPLQILKAAAYPGYAQANVQSYMPIARQRKLHPEEEADIAEGESNWFPHIFPHFGSSASSMLASPLKNSLLNATGAGLLGAGAGALLGNKLSRGDTGGTAIGAGIGAAGLGGLAGLSTYFSRQAENKSIRDLVSRLPRGATYRDVISDPVYQAEQDRRIATGNSYRPSFGVGYIGGD